MTRRQPFVLIVLDGWGYRKGTDDNAISLASTPTWDTLWRERPHCLISGSGRDVGLPDGQMGNSEVGHMSLGAGRIVHQDFTRISNAIADGSFFRNPVLCDAFESLAASGKSLHILGLLSPGGVHSHEDHIRAAIRLASDQGIRSVYIHAFLDGRDVPPRSAGPSLDMVDDFARQLGAGRIATITGRFYAMDRDNRWERVESAYRLIAEGEATHRAATVGEALASAYQRGEDDEFVQPTVVIDDGKPVTVNDGDVILFMNFRADRAREITRAFTDPGFAGFQRKYRPDLAAFITLTKYADDIETPVAFDTEEIHNSLGEYLSNNQRAQLRLAETEKYAHVTFFFSGGREAPFPGEDRILVPSPKVPTYDIQPEMSAPRVTDKLIEAIASGHYDFVVCNFANGDMVGHTGNLAAAIEAVECIDHCLARILNALEHSGGQCLITADHGNVEQMLDRSSGQAHTAHTACPVPLVYIGGKRISLNDGGTLGDIAPTVLALMDLPQPAEMTGASLAEITSNRTTTQDSR